MTGYTQEVSYDYTNQSCSGNRSDFNSGQNRCGIVRIVQEEWTLKHGVLKQYYKSQLLLSTPACSKACLDQMQTEQADFIELPMPSEKNISADTENVSDSIPAIRIKTKEGVSFEVFSNVSTEVLKYLIEVVIHAEWW